MNLAPPREDYRSQPLLETDVDPDPVRQFARWFDDAVLRGLPQPNQMALATATPGGEPSVRMVLMKSFDAEGFVFFTNYESRKARELEENPRGALVFYWYELHRQVRLSGSVTRVSTAESDAYFRTRPLEARLGAIASLQSDPLPSRGVLEERVRELSLEFPDGNPPLPSHWGGYRLRPQEFEFWQGRESRLHDRLRYVLQDHSWRMERLYP